MIAIVIAVLFTFVVIGVVMARSTSSRKKQAVESLKAEKEAVGHYSILDLVSEEVDERGLRSIDGADDLPPDVLLKVWKDAENYRGATPNDELEYVVADGVEPKDATPQDVSLKVLE
ncbi:MAG: hypothetical protein ACR2N7_10070 [Acidimicrobiia bacterium]